MLDAAAGMGYGRFGRLWRVELPLALPGIMTGIRLATVSTVALVTVGVVIGQGGLGQLIIGGLRNNFYQAEILTGMVLCVALGLALDLMLAGIGWLITPWTWRGRRAMNYIHQAVIWLNDPLNWTNPGGVLDPARPAPGHLGRRGRARPA